MSFDAAKATLGPTPFLFTTASLEYEMGIWHTPTARLLVTAKDGSVIEVQYELIPWWSRVWDGQLWATLSKWVARMS